MSLKEDDFIIVEDFVMDDELDIGEFEMDIIKEVPLLEDLEITPSGEEQNFKSENYYGFDNVKVKAVEMEEIEIVPSKDTQIKEGVFNKVTVQGEENLLPENIAKGKSIFGVEGVAESRGEENTIFDDEIFKTESQPTSTGASKLVKMITKLPEEIDLANWTLARGLFYGLTNLLEIPKMNTSKITDMNSMFSYCEKITTIPQLDTSSVTDMNSMFFGCNNLETIPQLDTSKVTIMSSMFYNCNNLKTIPQLDTSSVTSMSYMFNGCANLETIPQLDASSVTSMSFMFGDCAKLVSIPQLNTSKVTNMGNLFSYCEKITTIPQLDTSKVTSMSSMFRRCYAITTIPQLDASSVTNISGCFVDCNSLLNHGGLLNLGKAYTQKTKNYGNYVLNLSYSNNITHEGLMNIINNLYDLNLTYDVANGGTLYNQQLVLGNTNRAKLTADEIAIATNKGWTVV